MMLLLCMYKYPCIFQLTAHQWGSFIFFSGHISTYQIISDKMREILMLWLSYNHHLTWCCIGLTMVVANETNITRAAILCRRDEMG